MRRDSQIALDPYHWRGLRVGPPWASIRVGRCPIASPVGLPRYFLRFLSENAGTDDPAPQMTCRNLVVVAATLAPPGNHQA
jgi:hypothetical protein